VARGPPGFTSHAKYNYATLIPEEIKQRLPFPLR
jgi:hypothetical protein